MNEHARTVPARPEGGGAPLRARAGLLREEWERRFTPGAFGNPLFLGAYAAALQKRDAFGLLEALAPPGPAGAEAREETPFRDRFDLAISALRAGKPLPELAVPVSLFDYLERSPEPPGGHRSERELIRAREELIELAGELLEDAALSAFRVDLLGRFPSTLTPPITALLAPDGPGETPAARVPIELESFVGKVFRGYRVVRVLGKGGFGVVVLADHPTLPLNRALKIFLDVDRSGPGFERFRERCLQESRLQSTLKDENVVEVIDAFEDQGYVVQVMEYVDGPNLGRLIEEKNRAGAHLAPEEILEILIPVARGLAHAHRRGIVHRDLKPENILLDRARGGCPKIADFGLARHLEESGQRHHTVGHLVGTPLYMAPEQVASKAAKYDHRCDLYSFGVVAYQLALGLPPFDHEDHFKVLEMHEKEAPEPLSLKLEGFPEDLERIILCCLEKRPEDRFASAEGLLEALESCARTRRGSDAAEKKERPERRPIGRPTRALLAAGALALLGIAALPGLGLIKAWVSAKREPSPGPSRDPALAPGEIASALKTRPGSDGLLPAAQRPTSREEPKPPPPKEAEAGPAAPESDPKGRDPEPSKPEPKVPLVPLRRLLAGYPLSAEDSAYTLGLLDLFSKHRAEILSRNYGPLLGDLDRSASAEKSEYARRQGDGARELVRLADELVRARWKELSLAKGEVRLALADGRVVLGAVDRGDGGSITLTDPGGAKTTVDISMISPEEILRGTTLPAAEIAYQALSGDARKAISHARDLSANRENTLLWYPVLARLSRLEVEETARALAARAEAPLARNEAQDLGRTLEGAKRLAEALRAHSEEEAEFLSVYPYLGPEFERPRREGAAMADLFAREFSKVLLKWSGTAAYPVAATLLLASFTAELEEGQDELVAKKGWVAYEWQLRPDAPSRVERLEYWDVLDGGGCVLRDSHGPRSLVMGRPHPRAAEGLRIAFAFEPLGEERARAEWRLNLRREGGRNSALRFTADEVSLVPFGLDASDPERPIAWAALPRTPAGMTEHRCVLIPGEGLHVYLDGTLVGTFPKEDAIIPTQPSVAVLHGALSVRSIQVKKKPSK